MHPDHLIAVTGVETSALDNYRVFDIGADPYASGSTPISNINGSQPEWALLYQGFSAFATVLVVVPLVILGSAAGRLSTAQRDRRHAPDRSDARAGCGYHDV
jgi:hypothetical protein